MRATGWGKTFRLMACGWAIGLSFLLWGLFVLGLGPGLAQAQSFSSSPVVVLTVKGVIDPVTARYVVRGLGEAASMNAEAVVIQLDTPGGLDTAMREIVQAMLNASVPVVVYVWPRGARAGSAGVFITLAAHIAAMAPTTNIGAAHPVALGGGEMDETLAEKIVNDAAAYIRAIAQQRGRNVEWAEAAVRQSVSITAEEAFEKDVIDLVAMNLDDLLYQISGRTIELTPEQEPKTLRTRDAQPLYLDMSLPEQILHLLNDPTIAYILLTLGIYALIAAFYAGEPIIGTIGAILLILAFVAFGTLPLNWAGLALLILGAALILIDLKVQGFALSIVGGASFVLGSLLLFRPFRVPSPTMPPLGVSPWAIGVMTAGLLGLFLIAVRGTILAHRERPAQLSRPAQLPELIGAIGFAQTELTPKGTVHVLGEDWSAESLEGQIPAGTRVRVVEAEGLLLRVVAEKQQKEGG